MMIRLFCLALLCLLPSVLSAADVVCDFDGDKLITSRDSAILTAWLKLRRPNDLAAVESRARLLSGSSDLTVARLPSNIDKIEDASTIVGSADKSLLVAYLNLRKTSNFASVLERAKLLLGTAVRLSKLPGSPIGDSTVPVKVEGIQVDHP